MTARYGLRPSDLGLKPRPGDLRVPVLTSKRKKPGGGFKPNNPEDRFWIVNAHANAQGIRPEDPDYKAFNSCTMAQIVSKIPVEFAGHRRQDVEELSRGLHRWQKGFGAYPEIYQAPDTQRAFCSTMSLDQSGGPKALRWKPDEKDRWNFREIDCPGDACEFATDWPFQTYKKENDPKSPCIKRARLYFWPRWDLLADRIAVEEDPEGKWARLAERLRRLPKGPLKLVTGGQYAPSVVNFNNFMAWVEKQADDLGLWPCSLVGLPFRVGVTKRSGKHQHTVYTFEPGGAIQDWLLGQADWRKRLAEGKRTILLLGPADEAEREPETVAADEVQILPEPLEVRPAHVADVGPAEEAPPGPPQEPREPPKPEPCPEPPSTELRTDVKVEAYLNENKGRITKPAATKALGAAGLIQKGQRWYNIDPAADWGKAKAALDGIAEKDDA